MKYTVLILITLYNYAHCRPQTIEQQESSTEVGGYSGLNLSLKENLLNSPPEINFKMEDKTKEILEKIAEVNKKQGLTSKKVIPSYFHFPFSYTGRSQHENINNQRHGNDFKFPITPFTNPILEYLEREHQKENNAQLLRNPFQFSRQTPGYVTSVTDPNAEISEDDKVPGQYIKRKITHFQSFVVPNSNAMPGNNMYSQYPTNFPYQPYMPMPPYPMPLLPPQNHVPPSAPVQPAASDSENKTLSSLEKQTIENIKNIVTNSQMAQINPYFLNPYTQYPQQLPYLGQDQNNQNVMENRKNPSEKARQNWNWPGANLFPIYVRDPFLQMYYAFTNMVEYGPNAGSEGPCKLTPIKTRKDGNIKGTIGEDKLSSREGDSEIEKPTKITFEMKKKENLSEITVYETDVSKENNKSQYLDVENIDIGGPEELVRFTINLPITEGRDLKELNNEKQSKTLKKTNSPTPVPKRQVASKLQKVNIGHSSNTPSNLKQAQLLKQSPPIRDHILHDDELEYDVMDEKAEDVNISNQGTKKVFSKDNTGSGVFIHKLKVRKGGVAIAGPGGIATAGSGGTAIVGPNGLAYTHPDSLAIAGSGAKVIAVDPSISLSDIISGNRSRTDMSTPRLGKVVAVGPVVYYNQG